VRWFQKLIDTHNYLLVLNKTREILNAVAAQILPYEKIFAVRLFVDFLQSMEDESIGLKIRACGVTK
jgi:hypothetical protein